MRCISSSLSTRWYLWGVVFKLSKLENFELSALSGANSAKRESWGLADVWVFLDFLRILLARLLNSNSSSKRPSSSSLGWLTFNSSRLSSTGTSVLIVARKSDRRMSSTWFSTFVFNAPFSSEVWARSWSMFPNWPMSLAAVFSPTPGQPGKLSAASPIKASKSMTAVGEGMLYLAFTSSGPITS